MTELRHKTKGRLDDDSAGFTLIEVLVVLVIIGILFAIAVPAYIGFEDRANQSAAKANIRSAVPIVETYFADNATYAGMSLAALQLIDPGISLNGVGSTTASTYCVDASVNGSAWNKAGPGAPISAGLCP